MLDLFDGLSERSLYYRFMTVPPARHVGCAQDRGRGLRRRRWCSLPSAAMRSAASRATTAIRPAPSAPRSLSPSPMPMQGHGLGTRMLERLAEIARERGVRAFDAYVLGDNLPMMDVFLQSGFALTQGLETGDVPRLARPRADRRLRDRSRPARPARRPPRRSVPFFEPQCIAVIGANQQPGHIGSEIFRNLQRERLYRPPGAGQSARPDDPRADGRAHRRATFLAMSISR